MTCNVAGNLKLIHVTLLYRMVVGVELVVAKEEVLMFLLVRQSLFILSLYKLGVFY